MKYADERWWAVSKGEGCLLVEEMREGWHFCNDFDLELLEARSRCRWCGWSPPEGEKLEELRNRRYWRARLLRVLDDRCWDLGWEQLVRDVEEAKRLGQWPT